MIIHNGDTGITDEFSMGWDRGIRGIFHCSNGSDWNFKIGMAGDVHDRNVNWQVDPQTWGSEATTAEFFHLHKVHNQESSAGFFFP